MAPRKPKVKVEAAPAKAPRFREAATVIDARAAARRAEVQKEYEELGYGPVRRTSCRWIGARTKGLPFSRCKHIATRHPSELGTPVSLVLQHPTKGRTYVKKATPALLAVFFPSLPPQLSAQMLGFA